MKKFTLFFVITILTGFTAWSQSVVVAGWTFPGSSAEADTGIIANVGNEIYTMGGTSEIDFKNGYETKAAQATGWNDGMDLKYWLVELTTIGYENLTISSRQSSGGNEPGPKDFKIQYTIDGADWIDVVDGTVTVENGWGNAFVDNLSLAEECDNADLVMIRWIMISNEASGGAGPVLESGKSKIDEIYIRGDQVNSIDQTDIKSIITFGPNPANDFIYLSSEIEMQTVYLFDIFGKLVKECQTGKHNQILDITDLRNGIYIMSIFGNESENVFKGRIIVN